MVKGVDQLRLTSCSLAFYHFILDDDLLIILPSWYQLDYTGHHHHHHHIHLHHQDYVHVMCYDYHGKWDKKTGHNAPLYPRCPLAHHHWQHRHQIAHQRHDHHNHTNHHHQQNKNWWGLVLIKCDFRATESAADQALNVEYTLKYLLKKGAV